MSKKGDNIYKRKDGRWEGRYVKNRVNGKVNYGYVYAKSYREAKVKLQSALASQNTNVPAVTKDYPTNPVQFHEISTNWLNAMKSEVKESTFIKYQNLVETYIIPYIGGMELCKMTNDSIESHCKVLLETGGSQKAGLSPKTVTSVVSVIRTILRYAGEIGETPSCDAKSIHIRQEVKEMRVFTDSEQRTLCDYLCSNPEPGNLGILVCLFTGLRVGEICALRWEDFSLSEQTIHVHSTMQRIQDVNHEGKATKIIITTPKSQCSNRTIPVPSDIIRMITAQGVYSKGFFLTNREDRYLEPRAMQFRFKKVLKDCSIRPANFHALRHTFATKCVELGFDVKTLSEILGHANVNITLNRYVHPTLEMKKTNMKKLSLPIAVK